MRSICLIDSDPAIRDAIAQVARKLRLPSETAATLAEGVHLLSRARFDVLLLPVRLPEGSGLTALPTIKRLPDAPEVILLTEANDPESIERALQEDVWDVLVKPATRRQIMRSLQRALRFREQKYEDRPPVALSLPDCVTVSPRMRPCLDRVAQAAWSNAPVLITGETGTGKELFARLIHTNSPRCEGPFITVDCAALTEVTETLGESTLFGHVRGAFPGADKDRAGLVRLAEGGTLFLSTADEMPLRLQRMLLRAVHEKRVRPLGAGTERPSNVRLVAAADRDLEPLIEQGLFRREFYFRLRTIDLHLPPLRERPEDIKPLALFFVDKLCATYGLTAKGLDAAFLEALTGHDWPGNVRELHTVVEQAILSADRADTLAGRHLPEQLWDDVATETDDTSPETLPPSRPVIVEHDVPVPLHQNFKDFKESMERHYLDGLVREYGRNVAAMLDTSGLSRSHFYALLKKYSLSIPVDA